jgi:hypothetical protein
MIPFIGQRHSWYYVLKWLTVDSKDILVQSFLSQTLDNMTQADKNNMVCFISALRRRLTSFDPQSHLWAIFRSFQAPYRTTRDISYPNAFETLVKKIFLIKVIKIILLWRFAKKRLEDQLYRKRTTVMGKWFLTVHRYHIQKGRVHVWAIIYILWQCDMTSH